MSDLFCNQLHPNQCLVPFGIVRVSQEMLQYTLYLAIIVGILTYPLWIITCVLECGIITEENIAELASTSCISPNITDDVRNNIIVMTNICQINPTVYLCIFLFYIGISGTCLIDHNYDDYERATNNTWRFRRNIKVFMRILYILSLFAMFWGLFVECWCVLSLNSCGGLLLPRIFVKEKIPAISISKSTITKYWIIMFSDLIFLTMSLLYTNLISRYNIYKNED